MAFRHWQGTPPRTTGMWKCPTCNAENTGSLEAGCTVCKAGADAKAASEAQAAQRVVEVIEQRREERLRPEAEADAENISEAFLQWSSTLHDVAGMTLREHGELAFRAGATWQRQQLDPVIRKAVEAVPNTPSAEGGWVLQMTHSDPSTWGDPEHMATPLDSRQQQTVLAALAFYRDNQLAYGAIPGQLSAQEVTELITKLSPAEEPAV